MNRLVLRPATVADLRGAYLWYQAERQGLAEEFLTEVRRSLEKVTVVPRGYAVVHRDTRRALVRRFPYGLFFRIIDETIVVVASYHLQRRPATWKRRR